MIRLNISDTKMTVEKMEEIYEELDRVQKRCQVRKIKDSEVIGILQKMQTVFEKMMPAKGKVGARLIYIEDKNKSAYNYNGITMATRITMTMHTNYIIVDFDRAPVNRAYTKEYELDLSGVANRKLAKQELVKKIIREYSREMRTKLDL